MVQKEEHILDINETISNEFILGFRKIGGINIDNCSVPLECGADGIAVSAGIMKSTDIKSTINIYRDAMKHIKQYRQKFVSWFFYDLEQKLIYKAKQNQSTVIKVNPRYTSP